MKTQSQWSGRCQRTSGKALPSCRRPSGRGLPASNVPLCGNENENMNWWASTFMLLINQFRAQGSTIWWEEGGLWRKKGFQMHKLKALSLPPSIIFLEAVSWTWQGVTFAPCSWIPCWNHKLLGEEGRGVVGMHDGRGKNLGGRRTSWRYKNNDYFPHEPRKDRNTLGASEKRWG